MISMGIPTWSGELLGVELDDQRLAYRDVDVLPERLIEDGHLEALRPGLQPRRDLTVEGVEVVADDDHVPGLALEGDGVTLADPVGRDRHPLAVDQDVAVADELAGLGPAGAPAGTVCDVVQALL